MATALKNNENPPEVDENATQNVSLPSTALIGIFGKDSALRALIRTPDGKISRIGVGDAAIGGKVTAIGPTKVVIDNHTATKVLVMPTA